MPGGAAGGERRGQNTSHPSTLITASGELPREETQAARSQSRGSDCPDLRAAHAGAYTPPLLQLRSVRDLHLLIKSLLR